MSVHRSSGHISSVARRRCGSLLRAIAATRLRCGVTSIVAASAAALMLCASASAAPTNNRVRADRFMNMTYTAFAAASVNRPTPFNWSTDGCNAPTPVSIQRLFRLPCQQHDFGYRNYGTGLRLGRNEGTRAWIDGRMLTEMRRLCQTSFPAWWQEANERACRVEADTMWVAVRHWGRSHFYG